MYIVTLFDRLEEHEVHGPGFMIIEIAGGADAPEFPGIKIQLVPKCETASPWKYPP